MAVPIRILSPELELLGEVDNYLSLSFGRSYHGVGEFQIVTNIEVQNAYVFQKNRLIMLGNQNNKVGIIKHVEIDDNNSEILTVKGWQLKGITKQRITIPLEGQSHIVYNNVPADNVMKGLTKHNCVDLLQYAFMMLEVALNTSTGDNIKWQSRYRNLAEELEKISQFTGWGWDIVPDFDEEKWIFDTYQGIDRTAGQVIVPPVIFSKDFDNLESQKYINSDIGYANHGIVAGQGEGEDRDVEIVDIGSTLDVDLYVVLLDARDISDSANLTDRGESRLADMQQINSFEVKALTYSNFKYEEDWDLGDIVTVRNKKWGITLDARITAVTEIHEASGFRLDVVFGNDVPTFTEKIKKELENSNVDVRR